MVFVDKPDQKLKKHKNPVSLLGGLILLINFYLIIFILKIFNFNDLIFNTQFIYIIIFLSTLFYLVGFIDDLKNLTPNLKLLLICLSFVFVTFLFPEIKLNGGTDRMLATLNGELLTYKNVPQVRIPIWQYDSMS